MINSMVFPAPEPSYTMDEFLGELLHIPRGATGTFSVGMFVEATTKTPFNRFLVIYAHPNAVDLGMMESEYRAYARALGVNVLAFEFRGYGLCGGRAGEEELNFDAECAYQFAQSELHFRPSQIILMGRSIGTGCMVQLAYSVAVEEPSGEQPAMLFLESPFTSIKDCVKSMVGAYAGGGIGGFFSTMVAARFPSIDLIGSVLCPLLVIHGKQDAIVAYEQGQQLVQVASKRVDKVKGGLIPSELVTLSCGHNDLPINASLRALGEFLQKHVVRQGQEEDKQSHVPRPWYLCQSSVFVTHVANVVQPENIAFRQCSPSFDQLKSRLLISRAVTVSCLAFIRVVRQLWRALNRQIAESTTEAASSVLDKLQKATGSPSSPTQVASMLAEEGRRVRSLPTADQFIQHCLVLFGTPLGIYAPATNEPMDLVAFGFVKGMKTAAEESKSGLMCYCDVVADRLQRFNRGQELAPEEASLLPFPLCPLWMHLPTPALLTLIQKCVFDGLPKPTTTAAILPEEPSAPQPTHLKRDLVDSLQMEVQRFFILLSDEDWNSVQKVLTSACEAPKLWLPTYLSDEAKNAMETAFSAAATKKVTFEEARAVVPPTYAVTGKGESVPWDYGQLVYSQHMAGALINEELSILAAARASNDNEGSPKLFEHKLAYGSVLLRGAEKFRSGAGGESSCMVHVSAMPEVKKKKAALTPVQRAASKARSRKEDNDCIVA